MSAKTIDAVRELAEAWHAPYCTVDAGGGCLLHQDLKDAYVDGYLARQWAEEAQHWGHWDGYTVALA